MPWLQMYTTIGSLCIARIQTGGFVHTMKAIYQLGCAPASNKSIINFQITIENPMSFLLDL